ncbi:hypothetical protein KY335_03565 [Candidatus Woesearchaeota archaeon]|nr:hypothetical protein [Candidatus Woesearchaeota archaeon]
MVSVDACRILADATKIARHFAVILPFLIDTQKIRKELEGEDKEVIEQEVALEIQDKIVFGNRDGINSSFLAIAVEWMSNANIIGGVKPYAHYHNAIKDKLHWIQKPYVMFATGASADVSDRNQLGYDFFSMRNKFSNRLIRRLAEEPEEISDNVAVIPVTPILQPVHFTHYYGSFTAYNPFEPTIVQLGELRELDGRTGFGSVRKSLFDIDSGALKPGFTQHDLMIYESATAKQNITPQRKEELFRLLGPMTEDAFDLLVERSCTFNRHIAAMMYGKLIDLLDFPVRRGKKQIDIAASKNGPYYEIMKLAVNYYSTDAELTFRSKTFMRDIEMPTEREAHPTAGRRILARIGGRVVPEDESDNLSDLL